MNRLLFATGSRGPAIEEIQRALMLPRIDGMYGSRTTEGVCQFQRRVGLPPSGETDADTWRLLLDRPIPSLASRCLALTAAFEGHGYCLAQGNFDGAGITWGIIGFTVKSGSLGEVISRIADLDPQALPEAFGPLLPSMLENLRQPLARRLEWANSLSNGANLKEPWRLAFQWLGSNVAARQAQHEIVTRLYWTPAVECARLLGFLNELSLALCFDIQVQNGGIKRTFLSYITGCDGSERERREVLARLTASNALARWKADVLERKLTIATGAGQVHGRGYTLENWGLGEYRVA